VFVKVSAAMTSHATKVKRPVWYPSDAKHHTITKFPHTIGKLQTRAAPEGAPTWSLPDTTHTVMDVSNRVRNVDISFHLSMTRSEAIEMLQTQGTFVCSIAGGDLVKALHSTSWSLKNTPESAFNYVFALMMQLHDAAIVGVPATRTGPCSLQLLAYDCDYDAKTGRLLPVDSVRHRPKPYLEERKVAAYQKADEETATLIPYAVQVAPALEPHQRAVMQQPTLVYHLPHAATGRTVQYLDAMAIGLDTFVCHTPKGACVRMPQPPSQVCPDVLSYLICNQLGTHNAQERSKASHKVAKHPFQQWQYAHDTGTPFDPFKFTTQSLMSDEVKTTTNVPTEEAYLMPVSTRELENAYVKVYKDVLERTRGVWDCSMGLQLVFTPFDKARWLSYLNKDNGEIEFTAQLELLYLPLTQWLGPSLSSSAAQ
jgi:hypothetical protein